MLRDCLHCLQDQATVAACVMPREALCTCVLVGARALMQSSCCRFDILCVVKDVVDPFLDEQLARFVIGSHERSHPDADAAAVGDSAAAAAFAGETPPETISQDLLRKYITYAKDNCRPRLSSADYDKLATVSPQLLSRCSTCQILSTWTDSSIL